MPSTSLIQQFLIIFILMSLGFYLQELPTSNVLQSILPEWPFILTLYFSVSTRYFFGLASAFFIGLIEDVFLAAPVLGINAFVYVLVSFILISTRLRFRHMSIFSQSLVVGLLVFLKVAVLMIYNSIFYSPPNHFWVLLSVPTSMLVWPLLHIFFSSFSRKPN